MLAPLDAPRVTKPSGEHEETRPDDAAQLRPNGKEARHQSVERRLVSNAITVAPPAAFARFCIVVDSLQSWRTTQDATFPVERMASVSRRLPSRSVARVINADGNSPSDERDARRLM